MATTIVTKSGSGAPTASDLVAGELAVDLTNGRLYTEDSGGTVLELGLNPNGNVDVTGSVTADGLTVDGVSTLTSNSSADGILLNGRSDNIGQFTFRSNDGATNYSQLQSRSTEMFVKTLANIPMSFHTNNTERLGIANNGDISFYEDTGTTPKLAWSAANERLTLTGSDYQFGIQQGANQPWYTRAVSDGTFRLHLNGTGDVLTADSSGNVGIGVSPNYPIHVEKSVSGDWLGKFKNTHATNGYGLLIHAGDDASVTALSVGNYAGAGDYLVVKGDGKTGIGTASPSELLHVSGASSPAIRLTATNTPVSVSMQADDATGFLSTVTNHPLVFRTNNSEAARFDSSQNFLVGTSSQIYDGKQCNQFNGATHNGLVLQTTLAALNSTFVAFINSAGTACGAIIQNGTTTVNYGASSDRRLKENISDSDDSGLVIDAIQVRKFDWIGTDEHERYGFIAQELREVVPVAVCSMGMPDEEDPMLGVDPSKLMALAIKEIQSLRARVAALES